MNLIFKPHIIEKLCDKHHVSEDEVREAVLDPRLILERTRSGDNPWTQNLRYRAIGKSKGGRILRVILENVYDEFQVVTVFDAPNAERKRYERRR